MYLNLSGPVDLETKLLYINDNQLIYLALVKPPAVI